MSAVAEAPVRTRPDPRSLSGETGMVAMADDCLGLWTIEGFDAIADRVAAAVEARETEPAVRRALCWVRLVTIRMGMRWSAMFFRRQLRRSRRGIWLSRVTISHASPSM